MRKSRMSKLLIIMLSLVLVMSAGGFTFAGEAGAADLENSEYPEGPRTTVNTENTDRALEKEDKASDPESGSSSEANGTSDKTEPTKADKPRIRQQSLKR